jgi:hypothetical protein
MTDDAVLDETRQPARRKLLQVLGPGLITGAQRHRDLFAGGASSGTAWPGRWCSATC